MKKKKASKPLNRKSMKSVQGGALNAYLKVKGQGVTDGSSNTVTDGTSNTFMIGEAPARP